MSDGKIGNWLQVLSNLAVLVGLIFVGLQLYQDRELKRAEISAQAYDNRMQGVLAALGENPAESIVKAAFKPDQLTPEDAYIVAMFLDYWAAQWDRAATMERLGIYDGTWREGFPVIWYEFQTEIGHQYLDDYLKVSRLPKDFEAFLLSSAQQQTPDGLKKLIESWMRQASNNQ